MGPKKHINYIISPHLDDAVFSLGGLIAKEAKNTKVITIFAGIPAKPLFKFWDLSCGFKNSTYAMNERIKENYIALENLGVEKENIINLTFLDNQYRNSFYKKSIISKKDIAKAILDKIEIKVNNEDIRVYIPISPNHIDHKCITESILEVYKQNNRKKFSLYLYQDLPYFFTNIKKVPFTTLSTQIEKIELTNGKFNRKISASKLYKSQFRNVFSSLISLSKKQECISIHQVNLYGIKSPHCEIVYKII